MTRPNYQLKIWLLFPVGFLLLVGCSMHNGCKQVDLTPDERKWFSCYNVNQKILFKSNLNSIDTFDVIGKVNNYTVCNRFELGDSQYEKRNVTLLSRKSYGLQPMDRNIYMSFSKKYKEFSEGCSKRFDVFDLTTSELEDDSFIQEKIHSRVTEETYVSYLFEYGRNAESSTGSTTPLIKSFNWSKEYGLVRYTTSKGEVFDFWKKI